MAFGQGSGLQRQVISTLDNQGRDVMGLDTLAWKYPDSSIVSGSLLTVESNHFCVLKSRGAVLDVYETGQHQVITPDKPILGNIVQGFFSGSSPWQYETIYVQRSKLLAQNRGIATSKEMAVMEYTVDYYVHVDTKDDAVKLITHMPFAGERIPIAELTAYAGPVIEQAINQIVQVTPMEQVNERIHDIIELAKGHLSEFLGIYGVHLNDVKVLIMPQDARMRELISLRAFGMTEVEAARMYLALKMADKGLISAPNAAAGLPFQIGGGTLGTFDAGALGGLPK
ncbi:SPFH domain-containing protein [Paraburkholderia acidipaludis]|uniref:SPFH domain-containing protein n=1 Tax=Paraburkholderia acidipaludis TaxID=660537 RepID=UPI00048583E1|nr:SPFH domain-containing protein [Paraburkholderia acidipaludis]